MTKEQQKIIELAKADAERRRTNAAYDGAMHDGGARSILDTVEAWLCGLEGRVPQSLEAYRKMAQREADPEWAEYQRLQKKFEGK